MIHGDARGADLLGKGWAIHYGLPHRAFPADWNGPLKKGAGFARNQQMIDEGEPDYCIAFPGGNGTEDMVRRAKAAGVKTFRR